MIFSFMTEDEDRAVRLKLEQTYGASAPVFTADDRVLLLWLAMKMCTLSIANDAKREARVSQEILDRTTHLEGDNATLRELYMVEQNAKTAAQRQFQNETNKLYTEEKRVEALNPLLAVALDFVSKFGTEAQPNQALMDAALNAKRRLDELDEKAVPF